MFIVRSKSEYFFTIAYFVEMPEKSPLGDLGVFLLISNRLNRIQIRGFLGGIPAKKYARYGTNSK